MIQTLIQILYGIIGVLMLALAACGLMLRKSRAANGGRSTGNDSQSAAGENTSNEKRDIAEAAVRFAVAQMEDRSTEPLSGLQPSPVSPWQQALRASTLHRNPVRR
jgi:hypothetical protein